MTPADRIRAAVSAVWDASPVPPTADDVAAAVCEALADGLVEDHGSYVVRFVMSARDLQAIAADLRGEVKRG